MANGSVSRGTVFVRKALSLWKKKNQTNTEDKLTHLQMRLEEAQSDNHMNVQLVQGLKRELVHAYKEEESFWSQKCRQTWLKEGERNTKFFHSSVRASKRKNRITKLMDVQGNFQRMETSKGEVAADYFRTFFTVSNPTDLHELLQGFLARVTQGMNDVMVKEIYENEVKDAVLSIKLSSAPGPHGITALFFQSYWHIVGKQITRDIQQFFIEGKFPTEWNYTYLCLISKKTNPVQMQDMRPISLCSVIYKIISKILVKRLQPWLPDLISPTQTAFVANRYISDNILIAHEVVHSLRTTNISKAYDMIEWRFVEEIQRAFGFHPLWIKWVMFCISSVSFSVLINGQPHGLIYPGRGLRQGDLSSPFLFFLCTEGLINLMNKAEQQNLINGIQFSPQGPSIHHLLFADDSLFVCKAQEDQVYNLKEILEIYGRATGQKINFSKSSITFGKNVDANLKPRLQQILGITNEGGAGVYLEIPKCFSGSKVEMLSFIKSN